MLPGASPAPSDRGVLPPRAGPGHIERRFDCGLRRYPIDRLERRRQLPALLVRRIRQRPADEVHVDAAVSGYTTASGLPTGLAFDADGTGSCPGTEPGGVCGTPTNLTSGAQTVAVTTRDADANRATGNRDPLTFQVPVLERPTLAGLSVGGVSGGVARQGSGRRKVG